MATGPVGGDDGNGTYHGQQATTAAMRYVWVVGLLLGSMLCFLFILFFSSPLCAYNGRNVK
jgi:hypothetical protein